MTRRLSMATRRDLVKAVGEGDRRSDRSGKRQMLDGSLKLTGYHRKHAIGLLCNQARASKAVPGLAHRYTDEVPAATIEFSGRAE